MLQNCCFKHSSQSAEFQVCGHSVLSEPFPSSLCWETGAAATVLSHDDSKVGEESGDEAGDDSPAGFQFSMVLEKSVPSSKWGIDIEWRGRTNLRIVSVNDGIVSQWNARNPSKQLQAGDLIVGLNGVMGNTQGLLHEIQNASRLEMLVQKESVPMVSTLEESSLQRQQSQSSQQPAPQGSGQLAGALEAFQALTTYPGYRIYDVNVFEADMMKQNLQNYYKCCIEAKDLIVTTSCFSVWQKAKKTNGTAKVIPAIPASFAANGEQAVRMFFFDDNINLHLGGAETADGICNLRDIVTGQFVDFSVGSNGFAADKLFRHTTVHHSESYNAVLIQANILDAMVHGDYFSSILDKYSKPGEKLLVYADINGTLVWDDTIASKSVNEIMLCTMFRFAEIRLKSDDPVEFQWESQPVVELKNEDLRSLIHRISNKDDEYYQRFWSFNSCRKFIDQVGALADIAWLKQKSTIDPNQFFVEYQKNIDDIDKVGVSDGIPESWISCYNRLVDGGHAIVLNTYGVDSAKVIKRMSLDFKEVLHLTINRDMWGQRDANAWNKLFQQPSGYNNS